MRSARWFSILMLTLATACAPAAAALAAPVSPQSAAHRCSTSRAQGSCGPYNHYSDITGITSGTSIGNNVWNPISGWHQTLVASSPGSWQVTANVPAGNTAVVSYPSVGAHYGRANNTPTPLGKFSKIRSSFSERMNATARTSAWAAYDIWLGHGTSSDWTYEVMIQNHFAKNGPCSAVAKTTFPGPRNTRQHWHLCKFGSELVWKLGTNDQHKINERTGVVHVLSMLRWLVRHHYLPANAGLWEVGYGWEICSTGGRPEKFVVKAFTLQACRTRSCR